MYCLPPVLLLFLLFFQLSCSEAHKDKNKVDLAILNGNVIDIDTGEITTKDIFISDGKIQTVHTAREFSNFIATDSIDASNTYILPGFWDNHVHFRGGDSLIDSNKNFLKLFIVNGITTVRDAGGDLTTSVKEWNKEITANTLVGPTIFTSGPKIDGPGGTWAGSLEVSTDEEIDIALDSLQQLQTDFVKLYDSKISSEAYLSTLRKAKEKGMITSGHMPFTVTLNETVDCGIDAIEHLYYIMKGCAANEIEVTKQLNAKSIGFWEAMPLLQSAYSNTTAQKTFATLKENNVFVVPTLHIGKTLSYLDEVDHSKDAYLQYMSPGIIQTYQGRIRRAQRTSIQGRKDRKALDSFFGKLTKALHDADVGILAGSDSGAFNSYTYPGISLHKELQALVANGLTPLEALQTSSKNGAIFLKKVDYNNIKEGNIADLVLLEANPLEKISNTTKIKAVIKNGTAFSKNQLKELLASAKQY